MAHSRHLDILPTVSLLRRMTPQERSALWDAFPPDNATGPTPSAHARLQAQPIVQAALERLHTTVEYLHACYDCEVHIFALFRLRHLDILPALQQGLPLHQPDEQRWLEQIRRNLSHRQAEFIGIHPTYLAHWDMPPPAPVDSQKPHPEAPHA